MKRVHNEDDKKYECDICGKTDKIHTNILMHKKNVHKEKSHKCSICDKIFSSALNLKMHGKIIHEGKAEEVKCDL